MAVEASLSDGDSTCPGCGGPLPDAPAIRGGDRLHGTPGQFVVHVCPACGSGRTRPRVPTDRLGELYPRSYNAYALPAQPILRGAASALSRWRYLHALRTPPLSELARLAPGRLLDVGSGRGDLGVTLKKRSWQVTGIEPSPEACKVARERGAPSVEGTLTTVDLDQTFDVGVLLYHALDGGLQPLHFGK